MFGNQAGVIAGIKLAGPVTAAVWQPSQPILTAAICITLRWELPDRRRIAGVNLSSWAVLPWSLFLQTTSDEKANRSIFFSIVFARRSIPFSPSNRYSFSLP
jgi:hypothetical protein